MNLWIVQLSNPLKKWDLHLYEVKFLMKRQFHIDNQKFWDSFWMHIVVFYLRNLKQLKIFNEQLSELHRIWFS